MDSARDSEKSRHTLLNRQEYDELYDRFKWVTPQEAQLAQEQRSNILTAIDSQVEYRFHHTKLVYQDLSPGCRLCGEGAWSCLFINNLCNGRCFFCPSAQISKSEPATNGIPFPNPRDYIDYIQKFNIQGAGISGGEPLLTFDRTLRFVDKIKKTFGQALYLWLYTNGLVADQEKLTKLQEAGLDEIRFNLIASDYDLSKIKMAVSLIPTVTVEIPAAPDHAERLKRLLHELQDLGVRFLNLHQLRCTPHNARAMIQKGYTLLHGPKATVLESELTALRTIQYAIENRIQLPINYCSFVYKDGAQTLAYRQRLAALICKPFEDITALGAIRRMSLREHPAALAKIAVDLKNQDLSRDAFSIHSNPDRLFFNQSVLPRLNLKGRSLWVAYYLPVLMPGVSYQNPFEEIRLNKKKKVIIERKQVLPDRELHENDLETFKNLFIAKKSGLSYAFPPEPLGETLKEPAEWEQFRPGLQDYY